MNAKSAVKTWDIVESDGTRRRVTLSQFRAMLDASHAMARPIMAAWRAGNRVACEQAQNAMRAQFPKG